MFRLQQTPSPKGAALSARRGTVLLPAFFIVLLLPIVAVGQNGLPSCPRTIPANAWDKCQGNETYPNGERYVGEYLNGQRGGLGTYRFAKGNKYVGEYKDGQPNGQGTLTFANGDKYVGGFKDGYMDGQGIYTYASGGKYVGKFEDGKRSGPGTYIDAKGDKYIGNFRNDQLNGKATFTSASGIKYVGEYKDGNRNGQGILILADGSKYVGEFRHNAFNGEVAYPNGDKYVGEIEDSVPAGQGTYAFINGEKYIGEFKNGKPNGQGTETYSDGSKYVGGFKDGKRDGNGTFFNTDGSINTLSRFYADGTWLDRLRPRDDRETITMEKSGGVFTVPVRFNDTITLDAVVDSGASDVSIPADIVSTLMRTKTITDEDFVGEQTYVLADGSKVPSLRFRIRSMKVGTKTVQNVVGSIASVNATILLGQSFLSKFKSWSVDNEQHTLVLR